MKTIIIVLVAAILGFFFSKIVLNKPQKPDDAVEYTCDVCGEQDCICYEKKDP